MDKIRIGNDIHIVWSIFRDNQPEVFEGKDVEVRLIHTRTRDVIPLEWVISDGVVSATFYGKDQIDTGDYKLMLVENNGAPNMATIDECKAFTLVQYSCQEQKEEPSTSLQLHKVQLTSYFALSGGGNINVEGYPNVDELEEVKELSGNENIIITDSEGNKKTTIGNLKEYVVKDISELPPFRIFETESDYNAVKDELGDCVVCLRDTGVMLYHVYNKTEEGGGEIEDKYIRFADPEVQRILVENFSADKVGMTSEDIAKVTSIGTVFNGNTIIESFDDFERFDKIEKFSSASLNTSGTNGEFNGCTLLTSIKFPTSLKNFGYGAFCGCTSLKSIGSLANAQTINARTFYNCTSLEIEDLNLPNLETLGQNAFYGVKIKKISNLGKLTALPTASTSTQNFGDKSVLEEVVLPSDISAIPTMSFNGYENLRKLNTDKITVIGGNALEKTAITSLFLPNIETLRNSAIQLMSHIERIFLGGNIKTIEPYNFWRWSGSNDVYIVVTATTPPSMGGNNQPDWHKGRVYVPNELVEDYKGTSGWASFASVIYPIAQLETDNFDFYKEIEEYL